MANAPNLKNLHVDANKLKTFPQSILELGQLAILDIRNNDIKMIPPEISLQKSIKKFLLAGNPIKNIRQEIQSKNTAELMKYLETRVDPKRLKPKPE